MLNLANSLPWHARVKAGMRSGSSQSAVPVARLGENFAWMAFAHRSVTEPKHTHALRVFRGDSFSWQP